MEGDLSSSSTCNSDLTCIGNRLHVASMNGLPSSFLCGRHASRLASRLHGHQHTLTHTHICIYIALGAGGSMLQKRMQAHRALVIVRNLEDYGHHSIG